MVMVLTQPREQCCNLLAVGEIRRIRVRLAAGIVDVGAHTLQVSCGTRDEQDHGPCDREPAGAGRADAT